jgi:hypothetical protein
MCGVLVAAALLCVRRSNGGATFAASHGQAMRKADV